MKLYTYDPAPNPRRLALFMAWKGIDVETQQVDLMTGEQLGDDYRAINPECTVPTLVLDDGGEMEFASAPALEDFAGEIAAQSIGNYSLIFQRTKHSWHAVREINCPEGNLRRVFIVVTNPENLYRSLRDKVMRKTVQRF